MMLCGTPPFAGNDNNEIYKAIELGAEPSPTYHL